MMILVVGATGNVGEEAVRQLAERAIPVRAFVHSAEKQTFVSPLVETAMGDLRDPRTLEPALDGVSKALLISNLSPHLVELQGNFIRSAQRAGRIHVVKLSGLATSLNSPVTSGRWHALVEKHLADSGLPFTFLRPFFFMQNILGAAPQIARQGSFESSLSETPVAMIDFRDIASIAVAALTTDGHENKAYYVTGPQAFSMVEVAQEISRVIGRKVNYHTISAKEERKQLLVKGMPEWHVELIQQFRLALNTGMASTVGFTAEWFTGRKARTLTDLIRENVERFRI
jgi:uncharacterized protein YbjT (DUF2867 family)